MSEGNAKIAGGQPTTTCSERRGRCIFAAALLILAAFILQGLAGAIADSSTDLGGSVVGTVSLLLVLGLAFRDSQLCLRLARGCALIFGGMTAVLVAVILAALLAGKPLPQRSAELESLAFLARIVTTGFAVWALFFSRDVKAFLARHQSSANPRSTQP